MQIYLGSLYVNDFNRFGRTYQVVAQADAPFRDRPEDITRLKTRNDKGQMVPLGAMVKVTETHGPDRAMRYNGYPAAEINGGPAAGYSSGQAEAAMAKLLETACRKGMTYEWTELTYQRILAGNTAIYVYPLCILLVFLVLAAQYESFRLPLAIILIVPMCLLFAISRRLAQGQRQQYLHANRPDRAGGPGLQKRHPDRGVCQAQTGRGGLAAFQAAVEACRLRLRPILMTSIAFIAGVFPLVVAHGAGAEMRQAMGIAVFCRHDRRDVVRPVPYAGLLCDPDEARLPEDSRGFRPEPNGPALGAAGRGGDSSARLRSCSPLPRRPER